MFNVNSIDDQKTQAGTWTSFMGGEFLIAHTSNLDFQREFNRLQYPYRKQIDKGKLDPKISKEILCQAMAKYLLLDWKNVAADGEEIEYSVTTATKVLNNNEELREFVQDFSLDLDNFRDETIQDAGNG